MTTQGIIYVATGKKYISRASLSAASLKKHMPGMHVTIFADEDIRDENFDKVVQVTKRIRGSVARDFLDKILYIPESPYECTLFLDVDTYVCADITELFVLLDKFDIAVAHDNYRTYVKGNHVWKDYIRTIPESFPMLNSGVILFKKSPQVDQFLTTWQTLHRRYLKIAEETAQTYCNDQIAFREALYHSELKITVLPTEYNCRFIRPTFADGEVKILHGPHRDLPAVAKEINGKTGNRVFLPELGMLSNQTSPLVLNSWYISNFKYRLRRSLLSTYRKLRSLF